MRNLKSILAIAFVAILVSSCSKNEELSLEPVVSKKATNIHAPATSDRSVNPPVESGEFTKFSFKTGKVVTDNSWDIAFRATKIIVNGGTKIGLADEPERTENAALALETGTFASILEAPAEANFKQDTSETYALPTGSNNGWYSYSGPPLHEINPIAGKVIIIKTNDGHYAKMEILSYYKDNDSSNPKNARYYTFNYVYNPNKGDKSLE
ncbi:HmuY family protein [Polaribacter batillariae]|uniref:HmuY family protein n=1 Tax=Polaribacter batillariae TaxID=2808900 RepID=A0ABX7SWY3_9FLAO|nr:HmuY family protein [Polaribacter batillariae]QTD38397.1 HmuY family protein [Polaribacter batillariae]